MLSGSLTGMLVASGFTCPVGVYTECKDETFTGSDQPLCAVWGRFLFFCFFFLKKKKQSRVGDSSYFCACRHGDGKHLFQKRKPVKRIFLPPMLWWFPGRAPSSPPSCPGCGRRMQRASLQPQPIRARRYGALLLPNTIKPRTLWAYRATPLDTMCSLAACGVSAARMWPLYAAVGSVLSFFYINWHTTQSHSASGYWN